MKKTGLLVAIALLFQVNSLAQNKNKSKTPSVLEHTQAYTGFFNFNYDEKKDAM